MTPKTLARKIKRLRIKAPITESYERALIKRGVWSKEDVWYTTQKEHWLGWLSEYDGPGAYDRKTLSGRSAEFVFNHINCPPMLLWLIEAVGLPREQVLAARCPAKPRCSLCDDKKSHFVAYAQGAALAKGFERLPIDMTFAICFPSRAAAIRPAMASDAHRSGSLSRCA
jgi:hypothetical protein